MIVTFTGSISQIRTTFRNRSLVISRRYQVTGSSGSSRDQWDSLDNRSTVTPTPHSASVLPTPVLVVQAPAGFNRGYSPASQTESYIHPPRSAQIPFWAGHRPEPAPQLPVSPISEPWSSQPLTTNQYQTALGNYSLASLTGYLTLPTRQVPPLVCRRTQKKQPTGMVLPSITAKGNGSARTTPSPARAKRRARIPPLPWKRRRRETVIFPGTRTVPQCTETSRRGKISRTHPVMRTATSVSNMLLSVFSVILEINIFISNESQNSIPAG